MGPDTTWVKNVHAFVQRPVFCAKMVQGMIKSDKVGECLNYLALIRLLLCGLFMKEAAPNDAVNTIRNARLQRLLVLMSLIRLI